MSYFLNTFHRERGGGRMTETERARYSIRAHITNSMDPGYLVGQLFGPSYRYGPTMVDWKYTRKLYIFAHMFTFSHKYVHVGMWEHTHSHTFKYIQLPIHHNCCRYVVYEGIYAYMCVCMFYINLLICFTYTHNTERFSA